MSKQFAAVAGSHLTDGQAQVIGEETELIMKERGHLTPQAVVDSASKNESRLHGFFEWDDAVAADQHRLTQARYLLRSIEVYYVLDEAEEAKPMKALYNVISAEDERVYVPLSEVVSDDNYRAQVIEKALKEMKSWACKYRQYKELSPVIKAVDALSGDLPEGGFDLSQLTNDELKEKLEALVT